MSSWSALLEIASGEVFASSSPWSKSKGLTCSSARDTGLAAYLRRAPTASKETAGLGDFGQRLELAAETHLWRASVVDPKPRIAPHLSASLGLQAANRLGERSASRAYVGQSQQAGSVLWQVLGMPALGNDWAANPIAVVSSQTTFDFDSRRRLDGGSVDWLRKPAISFAAPDLRARTHGSKLAARAALDVSFGDLSRSQLSTVERLVSDYVTYLEARQPAFIYSKVLAAPTFERFVTWWSKGSGKTTGALRSLGMFRSSRAARPVESVSWYQQWASSALPVMARGASIEDLRHAAERRRATLPATDLSSAPSASDRILTSLQRVRRVLQPHAPPVLAQLARHFEVLSVP